MYTLNTFNDEQDETQVEIGSQANRLQALGQSQRAVRRGYFLYVEHIFFQFSVFIFYFKLLYV